MTDKTQYNRNTHLTPSGADSQLVGRFLPGWGHTGHSNAQSPGSVDSMPSRSCSHPARLSSLRCHHICNTNNNCSYWSNNLLKPVRTLNYETYLCFSQTSIVAFVIKSIVEIICIYFSLDINMAKCIKKLKGEGRTRVKQEPGNQLSWSNWIGLVAAPIQLQRKTLRLWIPDMSTTVKSGRLLSDTLPKKNTCPLLTHYKENT